MARHVLKAPGMRIYLVVTLLLASFASARADELPPKVADSVLAVAKDHTVLIDIAGGRELTGTLAAYDSQSITLVESGTRRVVAIARIDVGSVRLADPTSVAPPSLTLAEPAALVKKRYVGLQLGTGPGNVYLDVDVGHFYGFVGTSIGYPIIFSGQGNDQYVSFAVGAGGSWKLAPHSNWKFDLLGTVTPTWWGGFSAGIGISAGFHYTSPNGFTAGIKIPVIGLAPGCNTVFSDYGQSDNQCSPVSSGASLIANYYLQAAMSLPTVSVGYRF